MKKTVFMQLYSFFFLLLLVFSFSCSNEPQQNYTGSKRTVGNFDSTFFWVDERKEQKAISVVNPLNHKASEEYVIADSEVEISSKETFLIPASIDEVVCISTSHIGFLSALGVENTIVGVLNPELMYSKKLRDKYRKGEIVSIGAAAVNMEKLIELDPDLIFASVYDAGGMEGIERMRELGLTVVLVSEFLEEMPLQRAKWIKFFAAFFGENVERRADSIYKEVSKDFLRTAALVENTRIDPKVITGLPWKGTWYVPGGNSFQANFFHSAGADYIFGDNEEVNSLVMDFEVMLQKGTSTAFWLNVSDAESLNEIIAMDSRFKYFEALKDSKVFNNNLRKNRSGGNDYWETGPVRPDIVLKDLVRIFHPEILPNHQLFYYQQLKWK